MTRLLHTYHCACTRDARATEVSVVLQASVSMRPRKRLLISMLVLHHFMHAMQAADDVQILIGNEDGVPMHMKRLFSGPAVQ